jgi:phage terminase large subunit
MDLETINCYVPQKAIAILEKPDCRYRVLYGGRGSGKSTAFATYVIFKALSNKRILCCREIQNSIRDSVHRLLCDRINEMGLEDYFNITQDSIRSVYGAEIIFRGLRNNVSEIKSLQGIHIVWAEEAEKVSEQSWQDLIPTIREEGSEIWISFNPESESSPAYQKFVLNPREDVAVDMLNWQDNEFFPEVLRKEMEYDKRVDFEKYMHVWEGRVKKYGEAVIFKNKFTVEEFETPADAQFHLGADFGFSVDPSVLVRMFIKDRVLFIDYEAYGHGVEIEDLPAFYDQVPGARKWKITADSERPDTISFLHKRGFHIVGAQKGKGSVEDGIQFLRSFEKIIIHPRCKGSINNFGNYKWKQDRITQEILPVPAEGSDHIPDACRYALEDYIKAKEPIVRWL